MAAYMVRVAEMASALVLSRLIASYEVALISVPDDPKLQEHRSTILHSLDGLRASLVDHTRAHASVQEGEPELSEEKFEEENSRYGRLISAALAKHKINPFAVGRKSNQEVD
ncbi:hypothetical protein ACFYOT_22905 [Saccharothrix saharensis]|uniref:hypothetical protein n=1 Tax=Saccharothrix saharensis TaxID=571190 RepID=UPI0036CFC121